MINFPFKNSILSTLIKQRIKKINRVKENPLESQNKVLQTLIKKAEKTVFGIEHKFDKISNYENFKNLVPSRKYEELYPYIEQIRQGYENILWPGKTKMFAKSSGTTNAKSKFIPLTNNTLYNCHFKGGKDMIAIYLSNNPESKVFNGKGIMLAGSKEFNSNVSEGDLSALLLEKFPYWVNSHRLPDMQTALMKDWNEKMNNITNQSIKKNITNLTGVPSWMLFLLKNVIKKTGANNISEVWPNLELYFHGGINFMPYKKQFNSLIPSLKMNYLEIYNASEGFFAIQDRKNANDMLLMLDYEIFYEFITRKNFEKENKEYIKIDDVKTNVDYVMIISTSSGLWRYQIGDIIQFTSTNPHRIIIKGRTKNCINVFGEELMIHNSDQAIYEASLETNAKIVEYTIAPIFMNQSSGAHEWAIEFEKPPNEKNKFIEILDKKLKSINSDYDAKRSNNLIIDVPQIYDVKKGVFLKWLENKNKLGGQNKIQRLSETRIFIEEIKKLNT